MLKLGVEEAIENAWKRTIQDFEDACEYGLAVYWNEEVLRLQFFRHLFAQNINIAWFSAELETHIMGKRYKPDLIVNFKTKDEVKRCVFEFKFWGSMNEWKETWKKLIAYKEAVWFDYGYFIAIGPTGRTKKFLKIEELNDYKIKAFIHEKKWKEAFGVAESIYVVRELFKRTLNMPYHELVGFQCIATLLEDYVIIFNVQPVDKCLLMLFFPGLEVGSERWREIKRKLIDCGFKKFLETLNIDAKTSAPRFADEFKGSVLLEELEVNTHPKNVEKARKCLKRLKPVLVGLRPVLKLR